MAGGSKITCIGLLRGGCYSTQKSGQLPPEFNPHLEEMCSVIIINNKIIMIMIIMINNKRHTVIITIIITIILTIIVPTNQ